MKKFKKSKIAIIALTLISSFFIAKTDAYAKEMTPDEIPASSYVIGKYVFTRAKNEETGYNGVLTTNLLMLASKSIESDNLEDMKVYYKLGSGTWIEGATGEELTPPESFNVDYIDLQKEETVVPVEKPAAPIIEPEFNPLDFSQNTEMFSYDLWFYLDICEEGTKKVDGIEISHLDYLSRGHTEDIEAKDFHECGIVSYPDEWPKEAPKKLTNGRAYASTYTSFETTPGDYYNLVVRAYVKNENGEKVYSDSVTYSANRDTNFPPVEIINNYSNPKYIAKEGNYFVYKLGIIKPYQDIYNGPKAKNFAYIVHETIDNSTRQVGVYALDDEFIVSIKKGIVAKYSAQLGYYDKNGHFQYFMTSNNKYFTIDTRKLTAPVLNYNVAAEYSGPGSTPESIAEGEYIFINNDFYKNQPEDTLDYQIKGTEIYQVLGGEYELVSDKTGNALVFPPSGAAYYVARVYAINAEGEKVFSDFSNYVYVVRTPLITASEVEDDKVTITVDNIDEYWKDNGIKFTLYQTNAGNGDDIELGKIIYQGSQEAKFEIPVTENMEVYMIASSHDWRNSTDSEDVYAESMSSNGIDIVLE